MGAFYIFLVFLGLWLSGSVAAYTVIRFGEKLDGGIWDHEDMLVAGTMCLILSPLALLLSLWHFPWLAWCPEVFGYVLRVARWLRTKWRTWLNSPSRF